MGGHLLGNRGGSDLQTERKWEQDKVIRSCEPRVEGDARGVRRSPPRPSPSQPRAQSPGSAAWERRPGPPRPPGPRATAREARPGRRGSSLDVLKNDPHTSPELGKRPTSSAWARVYILLLLLRRDSPRQGGGDVCRATGAKKGEEGKKLWTRAGQKLRRWKGGTGAQQEGAGGWPGAAGLPKADRPA